LTEAGERHVQDRHPRAQTRSHESGVGSNDAAPENDDLAGQHSGDSAEQDARAPGMTLEVLGDFLHGHAPCDFTHRSQKGQLAARQFHRLVGDGDGFGSDERVGQLFG